MNKNRMTKYRHDERRRYFTVLQKKTKERFLRMYNKMSEVISIR